MSQTSLLDDIKRWTREELECHWQEASIHLITCLNEPDDSAWGQSYAYASTQSIRDTQSVLVEWLITDVQPKTDVLKTIYGSLVCVVPVDVVEAFVLSKIHTKTVTVFRFLLDSAVSVAEQSQMLSSIPSSIEHCLQCCTDILYGIDGCVTSLLNTAINVAVNLNQLHSLLRCIVDIIAVSYSHCKESQQLYGQLFQGVSGQLNQFFKTAHHLQVNFSNLLDKLDFSQPSRQEVEDMCKVLEGLSAVCNIAACLDVKVMIMLWKTISRLACLHRNVLNDQLDADSILLHIVGDVIVSCCKLSSNVQTTEADGGQMIKVLGFQMKVLVALVKDYVDSLAQCIASICELISLVYNILYGVSAIEPLSENVLSDFRRQVAVGLEPLVKSLVTNREFLSVLLSQVCGEGSLGRLLTFLLIMKVLPSSDGYVEFYSPIYLPGVMINGKPIKDVSLYEYTYTCICAFVASFSAKDFAIVEHCLLRVVFDRNMQSALLAVDVWCFLARFGSADLCRDHCSLLVSMCCRLRPSTTLPEFYHIVLLLSRLMKFMLPEHQNELITSLSLPDCTYLFSIIPTSVILSSSLKESVVENLLTHCTAVIDKWKSTADPTISDLFQLCEALGCVAKILNDSRLPVYTQCLTVACGALLSSLPSSLASQNVENGSICRQAVANMIRVCSELCTDANNSFIADVSNLLRYQNEVLAYCYDVLTQPKCEDYLKLQILGVLASLATKTFPACFEQVRILRLIAQLFAHLLADSSSALVRQTALQAFANFAEKTSHVAVVQDSLSCNEQTKRCVVDYLRQTSIGGSDATIDKNFLQEQYRTIVKYSSCSPDFSSTAEQSVQPCQSSNSIAELSEPSTKRAKSDSEPAPEVKLDEFKAKVDGAIEQMQSALHVLQLHRSAVGSLPLSAVERLRDVRQEISKLCALHSDT